MLRRVVFLLLLFMALVAFGLYGIRSYQAKKLLPHYTVEPVSMEKKSVRPSNPLGLSFHLAYELAPGIYFSEVVLEDALVLEDLSGKDSTVLKVLKNQTYINLPLEGMVGLKNTTKDAYNPSLVRDLPAYIKKDNRINISLLYTSPLVKPDYSEIQEKLLKSFDTTTNLEAKMLAIKPRGKNKLSENAILALFTTSKTVRVSPDDMLVSTIEVLK